MCVCECVCVCAPPIGFHNAKSTVKVENVTPHISLLQPSCGLPAPIITPCCFPASTSPLLFFSVHLVLPISSCHLSVLSLSLSFSPRYCCGDALSNLLAVSLPCRRNNKYFGAMWHLPTTFQNPMFWKVLLSLLPPPSPSCP